MKNHIEMSSIPTLTAEERSLATEMENSEMEQLIHGIYGTRLWIALIRYLTKRLELASGSLRTLDPVKEPTAIARSQGTLSGLVDLYNMVYLLHANSSKSVEK